MLLLLPLRKPHRSLGARTRAGRRGLASRQRRRCGARVMRRKHRQLQRCRQARALRRQMGPLPQHPERLFRRVSQRLLPPALRKALVKRKEHPRKLQLTKGQAQRRSGCIQLLWRQRHQVMCRRRHRAAALLPAAAAVVVERLQQLLPLAQMMLTDRVAAEQQNGDTEKFL